MSQTRVIDAFDMDDVVAYMAGIEDIGIGAIEICSRTILWSSRPCAGLARL